MKSRWPRSLSARLVGTTVLLTAAAIVTVAVLSSLVMSKYLVDQLDHDLTASLNRARHAPGLDRFSGPGRACSELPPTPPGQQAGSVTALLDESCAIGVHITGEADLRALSTSAMEELAAVQPGSTPTTVDLPALGAYRVAATKTGSGTIVIQGLPQSSVQETVSQLAWWQGVLVVLTGGTVAGVAWLLVRRQLAGLRAVAHTARVVSDTRLDSGAATTTARVPADLAASHDEVGDVGEALNKMLDHVDAALAARHESEQQARQFLADASHELRTPLTAVRGYAELSRRMGAPAEEALARIEAEAVRMSRLVEDMFLLARLDATPTLEKTPSDIRQVLIDTVANARVVDSQREWLLDIPATEVVVDADSSRVHRAVSNLLSNATQHTDEGTTIRVSLSPDPVRIVVSDDGPGISAEALPTIFDRFTRVETSRTRADGGAGLGLSLVKAIMAAHGGDVSVESRPGLTRFVLTFPAENG